MKKLNRLTIAILLFAAVVLTAAGCAGPAGQPGPAGTAGVSVKSASVSASGHLVLTLSDGQTLDAGNVVGPSGAAGATGPAGSSSFADIVQQVQPMIVRIDVTVRNGIDSGSGTIIDKRGYITTNNHVIAGARAIKVTTMDGTVYSASVVGADSKLDLAVIKLDTSRTDFPVMTIGTAADIRLGDNVMAMGFPGGLNLPGPATFTSGVISAVRDYNGNSYIQTDTPINPGNSGGCLFTLSGKMIGIPSAGITPTNSDFEDINLAIPIGEVTAFIAQYVK